MYVVCVTIKVLPGMGNDFVEIIHQNHLGTRQEPGNLRFDVLRQTPPASETEVETFFLYEVYKTEADFAAHQQTAHYFTFRDAVEPLMAEPRKGLRFTSLFPEPWA